MPTWLLIRLITIPLGIMSALALARDGFGFKLFAFLDAIITAYGIVLDDLFLDIVLAIFDPVFNALKRWFDWNWNLYPHWKYAFVLLWLFFAAQMRAYASPLSPNFRTATRVALRWVWAALAALIGSMLAGTTPLGHQSVLWWPVTAFFLWHSGDHFIFATKEPRTVYVAIFAAYGVIALALAALFACLALVWVEPPAIATRPPIFWWAVAAYFAYQLSQVLIWGNAGGRIIHWLAYLIPILGLSGALALDVLPRQPQWLAFSNSPSPGLANLTAFVAIVAVWSLTRAVVEPEERGGSFLDRLFGSKDARTALDVFAVLGGAAIIVYLSHLMA